MDRLQFDITLDKHAGFCGGVRRAFDIAGKVAQRPAYTLGPLVHNEEVTRCLREKGIPTISASDLASINEGTLIIPTHGARQETIELALQQGLNIVDTTCKNVARIHRLVESLNKQGYQIIVVGDKEHTEVKVTKSRAGEKAVVISNLTEASEFIPSQKKIAVVSQTTKNKDEFDEIVSVLKSKCPDIEIENTICKPVQKMQASATELAKKKEIIIIIGDTTSKNTDELSKASSKANPNTHLISRSSELNSGWLTGLTRVGITAGASTPPWVIEEVVDKIKTLPYLSEG